MKLKDDWHAVLTRAWSVRFMLLGVAIQLIDAVVPTLDGLVPQKTFIVLTVLSVLAGVFSTTIKQKGLTNDPKA